jgi:hypothetical protein
LLRKPEITDSDSILLNIYPNGVSRFEDYSDMVKMPGTIITLLKIVFT